MSIMALKIKAMTAQTVRSDVDDAHASSKFKLAPQRAARRPGCLPRPVAADSKAGRRNFSKVYRQFK